MRKFRSACWFAAGFTFVSAVALPLSAKNVTDYSALSDDKLAARYEKAADVENPDYCKTLLPLLSEMAKRPGFTEGVGRAEIFAEYQCAIAEERYKDAYARSTQLEKITGISQQDDPAAANRLINMAGSTDGSALRKLDIPLFWQLSRELVRNKQSEIRLRMFRALADSPHLDRLNPAARSGIAQATITLDAENGVFSRAKILSRELQGPYPFLELLANRKLESMWPALEEMAGPNLQKVADADV
ncbi:MAG: hypothetical protein ACK4ZE_07185, partial [Sphingorhabdus sp.]